jgi:hypothetical protein
MWSKPSGGEGPNSGSDSDKSFPWGDSKNSAMRDAVQPSVEKGDLAPVISNDGSGLP